jgi:hypothetical protein
MPLSRTMKRRLSSLATPYYRFAPPLLLIFGFAWMIVHYNQVQLTGAVFYVLVLGVVCVWSLRLKKVHLSSDRLYVSDYFRGIAIDTNSIARVEPSSWWGWQPRTIKLTFDEPSTFGSEIVFIPRGLGLLASEVANEIRAAKHAA